MLTKAFRHNVDAKNRLFIPAKFREELGLSFMIVKDIRNPRLKIYSLEEWEKYLEPIRKQNRDLSEAVMRFFHSGAMEVEPDSQGRVVLDKELLDYAGIGKEAVVLGCGDFGEIWSAERYDDFKASEDRESLLAQLQALGL